MLNLHTLGIVMLQELEVRVSVEFKKFLPSPLQIGVHKV
jgi:hypothetical protein